MRSFLTGAYAAYRSLLRTDRGTFSIESLEPHELLALAHHPAGSRVLDAIIDGATTPPRARRTLLRALEAQFADVIDDRIGARVGARCWAAADPYLKVRRTSPFALIKQPQIQTLLI